MLRKWKVSTNHFGGRRGRDESQPMRIKITSHLGSWHKKPGKITVKPKSVEKLIATFAGIPIYIISMVHYNHIALHNRE